MYFVFAIMIYNVLKELTMYSCTMHMFELIFFID